MTTFAYAYVGPPSIRQAAAGAPPGRLISGPDELAGWLRANPDAFSEGATFVVDLSSQLRLAPRRSEHVACAGGAEVLAAGEVRFARTPEVVVAEVSNQSTGYCPDLDSWAPLQRALTRAGLRTPPGFTRPIVFRRCEGCRELNLVKEGWFVCVFCDRELPVEWNVSPRREL